MEENETLETENSQEQLVAIVEEGKAEDIGEFLENMNSSELAFAMSRLSNDERTKVLTTVSAEDAADIIEQLTDAQAVDLLEQLPPDLAAGILDELPSADQADLIAELSDNNAEAVLAEMDPEEAANARQLIQYEADVAGGIMVKEYLAYPLDATVKMIVDDLCERGDEYRDYDIQYSYIVDRRKRVKGVLRMHDLLMAKRATPIQDIMIQNPVFVPDTMTLDELVEFFDQHHYLGVPVVDEKERLIGVVQQAAVHEAVAEQRDDDYLKTQGIVGGEEFRTMPLLRRSSRRLSWLSVNILLNIAAASVIAFFQDTLASVIALAVFLPIISDMSGCSGSQAVAVSMRELSLGLVRPTELLWVWVKEASVGIINGLVLGGLVAIAAVLWKGEPYLGLVVGVALCLNTVLAVSIGGLLPLVLKRFNTDPAIASGPILTTITDMCGFFLVLGMATMLLDKLI